MKKYYNDSFTKYLTTKKTYNTIYHKYFGLNMYK